MRPRFVAVVAALCLAFTLTDAPRPGWADDSRSQFRVRSPEVRAGTIVGHTAFAGNEYVALGGVVAVGARHDRLSGELEYDYLTLQADGGRAILGEGHRIGANARLDVARIGSRWVGRKSTLSFWTEVGAGRQWTRWRARDVDGDGLEGRKVLQRMQTLRTRPSRVGTAVGFGWLLDHRAGQPVGAVSRIGWLVGWRITRSSGIADDGATRCVVECRPPRRTADHGLLLHSSLMFTW